MRAPELTAKKARAKPGDTATTPRTPRVESCGAEQDASGAPTLSRFMKRC
jgi:hypothetical protein